MLVEGDYCVAEWEEAETVIKNYVLVSEFSCYNESGKIDPWRLPGCPTHHGTIYWDWLYLIESKTKTELLPEVVMLNFWYTSSSVISVTVTTGV